MLTSLACTMPSHRRRTDQRALLRRWQMSWRGRMFQRRLCGCKQICKSLCKLGLCCVGRWRLCRRGVLSLGP